MSPFPFRLLVPVALRADAAAVAGDGRARWRGALRAMLAGLVSAGVAATASAYDGTLAEALQLTVQRAPAVVAARARADAAVGALAVARSAFDVTLGASAGLTRRDAPLPAGQGAGLASRLASRNHNYSLSASWRLRNGVTVSPGLTVERIQDNMGNLTAPMRGDALVRFTVPMARGAGERVNTAPETAAALELQAAGFALRHAVAGALVRTVAAYWDHAAAQQALVVQGAALERAQRLREDAGRLARADEIPAADLLKYDVRVLRARQSQASQALAAHQAAAELARAMGLNDAQTVLRVPARDRFPDVDGAQVASWSDLLDAPAQRALVAQRRDDLRALQQRLQAAQALVDAQRDNLRPQVDLNVGVGLTGLAEGRSPASPLASLRGSLGPTASVVLSYSLPVGNRAQEGELLQRLAARDQLASELQALQDAVALGLATQSRQLRDTIAQLAAAREQADIQQRVRDNELRRYRAGLSTAFDLLASEEQLTQDQVSVVTEWRRLAQLLASARLESGLVLQDGDEPAVVLVPADRLRTVPTSQELQR